MSYDARWVGDCPECGRVEIVAARARLCIEDQGAGVEFRCPSCDGVRFQPVDGTTAELFQAVGAEVVVTATAEEPAEPKP